MDYEAKEMPAAERERLAKMAAIIILGAVNQMEQKADEDDASIGAAAKAETSQSGPDRSNRCPRGDE